METQEKDLLAKLAPENPDLADLVRQHQSFENRLEEMNRRPYLSPEEDMERRNIQKTKLAVKDKIQKFLDGRRA